MDYNLFVDYGGAGDIVSAASSIQPAVSVQLSEAVAGIGANAKPAAASTGSDRQQEALDQARHGIVLPEHQQGADEAYKFQYKI